MSTNAAATALPTRPLGRTDMAITPVGFGAWAVGGAGWTFGWGSQDDQDSIAAIRHAVSRGEWVLQIARCYGVSAGSVLAANRLANPDYILPGWILTIPDIGRQGPIVGPPCVISYTVATGDTWEMLATRHGTTTAILQRANPGLLAVGRSIWVPRVP